MDEDILITDEYIDVFPNSTRNEQLGYMVMLSPSHYPPETAPNWNSIDDAPGSGEKILEAWYVMDIDDSGGSTTINKYYPSTGEAVSYYDDFQAWANELSFQSSRYDVGIMFITFNLSGIQKYGPFSSASFIADLGTAANDEGIRLHGHSVIRSEYGSDYFDWARAYTSSPSGGLWKPVTLDAIFAGSTENDQSLDELPLINIPTSANRFHLRLALSYHDTPTNFNGITITPDYDAIDALTSASEEAEILAAFRSLPRIRFYRGGASSVEGEFDVNLNLDISATIKAEPLFHSARRRRNYLRR